MSDRVNRDSDYWPGKFTARLAKALEEEASFPCHQDAIQSQPVPTASIRTEHDGSLSSKEGQVGNRHGSKVLYKPSRDLAIVDGLSSTQYRHLQPAIQQSAEQTQAPESQVTKRILKRGLAAEVEILKEEMEDLKKMLTSLKSRCERKHVSTRPGNRS